MLKKYLITTAVAGFCAVGLAAQTPAPSPGQQNQPDPRPTTQGESSAQQASGTTTTITGCVYREEDIPGRTPNIAERAGVLEDYILVKSSGAQASTGAESSTPGAVGTSGSASAMYKLEHAADERLRGFVGKRVEVTGKIDAEDREPSHSPHSAPGASSTDPASGKTSTGSSDTTADRTETGSTATGTTGSTGYGASSSGNTSAQAQTDRSMGPDRINLPEFEVTSIREVEGDCPASPSVR